LEMATKLKTRALVIDTEQSAERLGRPRTLAEALGAEYVSLDSPELNADISFAIQKIPIPIQ
jgi:magnesium chelatase subunit D